MGRPPLKEKDPTVKTTIRLPASLLKRLEAVAGENKSAAFIRDAVEAELTRRERIAKRRQSRKTGGDDT